jgi:hypothetical protein
MIAHNDTLYTYVKYIIPPYSAILKAFLLV